MEGLNKRILCILLLGIFMIGFGSAFEFDNVKHYDPITRTATVNDCTLWIGGCLIEGDQIVKAMLESPLNVKVGAGEDKLVGWYTYITTEEDVVGTFGDLYLEDLKNGKMMSRGEQYKVRLSHDESVDDYKSVCGDVYDPINNTLSQVCEQVETGSHIETVWEWIPITNTNINLEANVLYSIGVFVDVEVGDHGDWKPTFAGKSVPEWAEWTADLNTNLIRYFKEDVDGTIDSIENENATNQGSTNTSGIINSGRNFVSGSSQYIDSNYAIANVASDKTVNLWVKTTETDASTYFVAAHNGVQYEYFGRLNVAGEGGTGAIGFLGFAVVSVNVYTVNQTWRDGNWHMITFTQSGASDTDLKIYIDGNSQSLTTKTAGTLSAIAVNQDLDIGAVNGNGVHGGYFDGDIDEVGIWQRALSPTEVTQLYNGGDGTSYTDIFENDTSPTIILNSPSSINFTSPQNLTINFTAYDDINLSDVKLYVNTVLNQTNASGINNTDYLFNLSLSDGEYTIYGKATDNASQETNSASIVIRINTTPFIEFLTPPTLINYANVTQSYVPMKVNVSTSIFQNITYSLRNINGTNYTQVYTNQTYDINFTSVPDGHYHYDVTVCATTGKCNITETRHINHDVTPPVINLTSPSEIFDFLIGGYSLDLNWTVSDEISDLDSCWYVYNNITTPISCSLNTTTFNYSALQNSLVFYSNDTFGNVGNETASWGYLILQTNQTYDSQVTEGTPNTIITFLNVVGDTISSAILSYNGTNYTTSLDYDSGNYTIGSTVIAPLFDADTNITFQLFMEIGGADYSTPPTTQLIQAINFSTCTSGDKLLNIFLLDEEDKTELFGTIEINAGLVSKISNEAIESVLMEASGVSNLSICLDPISAVDNFYLDADISYTSGDYAKEFYFMREASLSSIPINLSLFDLNLSSSTEFLVRYQGQSLIKVEGAIVQLQRYYISEDMYETVEAPLTGISGTAIVHIDLNTVKYKAIVVKDGEILDIFNDVVFDCENELSGQCTQNLYADVTPYNVIDGATIKDFSYAISDTGSKLVTTFSIPSGSTSAVNIVMTQKDQFGETTSCNRTVTTSSGSLECDYNSTIGDSYLFLEVSKDGESQAEKEYFVPEANGIDWGGLNWLFLFGLLISVSLMAISSPEWIVGNGVVVLIIGGALWMADGLNIVAGLGLILWVIVAAIILILEMANKEDR